MKKLQDSWNKSIKRSSLSNDSTNPIDTLNITNSSKVEAESPKKAVVARNNWGISNGIVDSDSEEDVDFIPHSEEDSDGESQEDEDEHEHEERNELVDDEVEVIENYESGDSMDEEERREIEGKRRISRNLLLKSFKLNLILRCDQFPNTPILKRILYISFS